MPDTAHTAPHFNGTHIHHPVIIPNTEPLTLTPRQRAGIIHAAHFYLDAAQAAKTAAAYSPDASRARRSQDRALQYIDDIATGVRSPDPITRKPLPDGPKVLMMWNAPDGRTVVATADTLPATTNGTAPRLLTSNDYIVALATAYREADLTDDPQARIQIDEAISAFLGDIAETQYTASQNDTALSALRQLGTDNLPDTDALLDEPVINSDDGARKLREFLAREFPEIAKIRFDPSFHAPQEDDDTGIYHAAYEITLTDGSTITRTDIERRGQNHPFYLAAIDAAATNTVFANGELTGNRSLIHDDGSGYTIDFHDPQFHDQTPPNSSASRARQHQPGTVADFPSGPMHSTAFPRPTSPSTLTANHTTGPSL